MSALSDQQAADEARDKRLLLDLYNRLNAISQHQLTGKFLLLKASLFHMAHDEKKTEAERLLQRKEALKLVIKLYQEVLGSTIESHTVSGEARQNSELYTKANALSIAIETASLELGMNEIDEDEYTDAVKEDMRLLSRLAEKTIIFLYYQNLENEDYVSFNVLTSQIMSRRDQYMQALPLIANEFNRSLRCLLATTVMIAACLVVPTFATTYLAVEAATSVALNAVACGCAIGAFYFDMFLLLYGCLMYACKNMIQDDLSQWDGVYKNTASFFPERKASAVDVVSSDSQRVVAHSLDGRSPRVATS